MRTGLRRFARALLLFVLFGVGPFGHAHASPGLGTGSPIFSVPGLVDSLAAGETHAYRVEGVWSARCDSMIMAGGTSLDCFVTTGELPIEATAAYLILLDDLSRYKWARSSHGWNSPSTPSLALAIDTDTTEVTLLVSLSDHRATMTIPGEGTAACSLPERDDVELTWCLWGLDPENPEVQPFVRSELMRLGLDPGTMPGEDFRKFLMSVLEPPPPSADRGSDTASNTVPARPWDQPRPHYPEFARVAGIEGTVVLRARVDPDGRVGSIEVVHSVPGLDQAARAAVSLWSFHPTTRDGVPVEDWVEVPVSFSLREAYREHNR